MKHVHADSLTSVFTDSTLSAFTETAKLKGVDYNSIIYIKCAAGDTSFGTKFVEGSTWIWERGEVHGFSGSYEDLTNKPEIPTKTSDLTNDSGFITEGDIPDSLPASNVSINTEEHTITVDDDSLTVPTEYVEVSRSAGNAEGEDVEYATKEWVLANAGGGSNSGNTGPVLSILFSLNSSTITLTALNVSDLLTMLNEYGPSVTTLNEL